MGKNKKQRNKKYTMDVDDVADTGPKGKGTKLMVIDGEPTPKQHTRDPLSVKMKPKRGQSSRKQKQRLATKLDKAMATSDRSTAKHQKRSQKSSQKQSLKHLWSSKESAPSLTQ